MTTVWVVIDTDGSLALIGATCEAAKRWAANYCSAELTWEPRHSMFDTQEFWFAPHDDGGLSVYEMDVET